MTKWVAFMEDYPRVKNKARREKIQQKRAKQRTAQDVKHRHGRLIRRILLFVVVTGLPTYAFYASTISVETDISSDPGNAIATLFRITNRHVLFPIYNVNCGVKVNFLYDPLHNNLMAGAENDPPFPQPNVPKLGPGEATSVNIPLGGHIMRPSGEEIYTEADVVIIVSYRTIVFLRHTKPVRFEAHLGKDKLVHWSFKALSLPVALPAPAQH